MNKIIKLSFSIFVFTIYSCSVPTVNSSPTNNSTTQNHSNQTNASPIASPTNPPLPDNIQKISFDGTVYNRAGLTVDGVTVKVSSIEPDIKWESETKVDKSGKYFFKDAPVGLRLSVTISKDGISKTRTEVLTTDLKDDPLANTFDFKGFYSLDSTLFKIMIFDKNNNQINNANIKVESLDPSFTFSRDLTVKGDATYSPSTEPLPINTKFKITVKVDNKLVERTVTTQAGKIYNEINFGGANPEDKDFAISL